ncbi:Spy/CpxP family protein refolding chaperone [Leptolyngbyaceae cyanobacterium UHCC 1019]
MNIKSILLLSGVLALTLTAVPFMPAFAQNQTTPNQSAPAKRGMNRLNLTDAQKTQMQQIKQATKSEIAAYLQSQGITVPQGQNPREAMRSLNLSEAQKAQIKAIREKGKQQVQGLLTTEQKAMMQQRRGTMKNRGQQRRQAQPGQFQPGQAPVQSGI